MANANLPESNRASAMSGTELVHALREGDALAQAAAWARVGRLARRIVGRYFGPGLDPADLVQEVLMRLAARLDELRDPESINGFVVGIALGVARNQARYAKLRRLVGLTPTGDSPEVTVAAADMEARDAVRRFYAILESARAEDRSLFVARYLEKLEVTEIAVVHAMSLGTTKRRMARAVERIGKRIARDQVLAGYLSSGGSFA